MRLEQAGIADPVGVMVRAMRMLNAIGIEYSDPNLDTILSDIVPELDHGDRNSTNGIVTHSTVSQTYNQARNQYQQSGEGPHYTIGRDGKIYLNSNADDITYHVGTIKPRNPESYPTLPKEGSDARIRRLYLSELRKPYPDRYVKNDDSVAIEFVRNYDNTNGWQDLTPRQRVSGRWLTDRLRKAYNLDGSQVFPHDVISYKTDGEGTDVNRALGLP